MKKWVTVLTVFATGMVVGQQLNKSRFKAYFVSRDPVSKIESGLLYANLDQLFAATSPTDVDAMCTPQLEYEPASDSFIGLCHVMRGFEKQPLELMRLKIGQAATWSYDGLRLHFPEVSPRDFTLRVYQLGSDGKMRLFAESRSGEITIH
jgi:hypothetical protein